MRPAALVLLAAGGTGGHVIPALALADALREEGVGVYWVGARRGIETRLVPPEGLPLYTLALRPWRGRWHRPLVAFPALLLSLFPLLRLMHRTRPCAVVAFGGYASAATALAAVLVRVPLVLHEQNAIPGWTSRLMSSWARVVYTVDADVFPADPRVRAVGVPVRAPFLAIPPPSLRFADRRGPLRVLVLGGSQGARTLNAVVPEALASLPPDIRVSVVHQTGVADHGLTRDRYAQYRIEATVLPFIDDMVARYAEADLAICRAGASTLAELAAVGLGAILIPYPHAVDDHQKANAMRHAKGGAASVLDERCLNPWALAELLIPLLRSRERLLEMATCARARSRPDAARIMAHEIRERFGPDGERGSMP